MEQKTIIESGGERVEGEEEGERVDKDEQKRYVYLVIAYAK